MRYIWVFIFGMLTAFVPLVPSMAQPQQPALTIEQRIGMEMGPIITRAAILANQVEQLQALLAARDKTIADRDQAIKDLQAQLKPTAEKPASPK